MRPIHLMTIALLGTAAAAPAQAQSGLLSPLSHNLVTAAYADESRWPQWQSRLTLGLNLLSPLNNTTQLRSGSLLSDYYFYRHPLNTSVSSLGGFRATSGLMLGVPTPRLLVGQRAEFAGTYHLGRHPALSLSAPQPLTDDNEDRASSYLGVGYTLWSLRGGWGLSANIGLAAARSNTTWGLGNSRLDLPLGEFRLTPLLHLGLTYSF
ncbi:MAG: hypothetical protein ACKOF9_10285 [Burkholderiales bacterium]